MALATTYAELRAMTKEELVRSYDAIAQEHHTELSLGFYREEIARRDAQDETAKIVAMTQQMRNLTVIITILTALNLAGLAFGIYFQISP